MGRAQGRGEGSPGVLDLLLTPKRGTGMSPRHAQPPVLGVGGGHHTQKGPTPRRKSSAAPWPFRGCQQLRLCLGLDRALGTGKRRTGQGQRGQLPYCFLKVI